MAVRGWQWAHNIHMDMPESGVRASESLQWTIRVACYFRSLAAETGFGPVAEIRVHFRLQETPWWESPWRVSKTCRRTLLGTRGHGFPVDTSHWNVMDSSYLLLHGQIPFSSTRWFNKFLTRNTQSIFGLRNQWYADIPAMNWSLTCTLLELASLSNTLVRLLVNRSETWS